MVVVGRCGKLLASDMWCEANAIKLLKVILTTTTLNRLIYRLLIRLRLEVHLGANVSSEASIVGRCNMLIGCLPSLREVVNEQLQTNKQTFLFVKTKFCRLQMWRSMYYRFDNMTPSRRRAIQSKRMITKIAFASSSPACGR